MVDQYAEGKAQGKVEGEVRGKQVLVRTMNKNGLSVKEISQYTGLSESEVTSLL